MTIFGPERNYFHSSYEYFEVKDSQESLQLSWPLHNAIGNRQTSVGSKSANRGQR